MSYKSDIQATYISAATSTVVIAPSIRLKGIIVVSSGGGTGTVELKTTSATGTTLFKTQVPTNLVVSLNLPEYGILFPQGIYVSTFTSLSSVTLLTDRYTSPGPMYQPQP
jgi:hypothetical protein